MAILIDRARHQPAYDTSIDNSVHAKSICNWADDSSDDTRLEGEKKIRLIYATTRMAMAAAMRKKRSCDEFRTVEKEWAGLMKQSGQINFIEEVQNGEFQLSVRMQSRSLIGITKVFNLSI